MLKFRLSHIISFLSYCAIILVALILLPGADIVSTFIAMALVWIAIATTYRYLPTYTECGRYILMFVATILSVGIISNVYYYTTISGGTTELPILQNPDANRFYNDALATCGDGYGYFCEPRQHGYGMLIVAIWQITGVTIVVPLIVNMFSMLFCVILSGMITWRLLGDGENKSSNWVISCAMLLTASVCYYINSGTLLLKDALICLAMALIILKFTDLLKPVKQMKTVNLLTIGFAVGVFLLMFLRPNFILYAIVGVVILNRWRDIKSWIRGFTLIAICVVAWFGTSILLSGYDVGQNSVNLVLGSSTGDAFFAENPQHNYSNKIIGGYLDFPWWKYLLYMPLCTIIQFLIPFPWGFEYGVEFGYSLVFARISYPWYIIGGIILYYIFMKWRKSPKELSLMLLWGFMMWLVPVYLFAGTVSRYALPMLPALIPVAVYVLNRYGKLRSFHIWIAGYVVVLIAVLIVCYNLQQSAM